MLPADGSAAARRASPVKFSVSSGDLKLDFGPDPAAAVGKREAVTVYELLERKGALSSSMQEVLAHYNAALAQYRQGDFRAARQLFERAHALDERDGPVNTYLQRCSRYIDMPPPSSWDGVYELDSK